MKRRDRWKDFDWRGRWRSSKCPKPRSNLAGLEERRRGAVCSSERLDRMVEGLEQRVRQLEQMIPQVMPSRSSA